MTAERRRFPLQWSGGTIFSSLRVNRETSDECTARHEERYFGDRPPARGRSLGHWARALRRSSAPGLLRRLRCHNEAGGQPSPGRGRVGGRGRMLAVDFHIQDLAADGSDQVSDHANLRCYEWCSDASRCFGPIRTQLLLRGLRPLRSPSDRRADREIRAGIRNPET